MGKLILASDGVDLMPGSMINRFYYNSDGTINYIILESDGIQYKQSFTYETGLLATVSKWIKQ